MLSEILKNSSGKSSWADWVATDKSYAARETREILNTSFLSLSPQKRSRLSRKIRTGDAATIDATIHEIIAYELLRRLDLAPDFEPTLGSRETPDIGLEILRTSFIADVFVTHSPSSTVTDFGNGTGEAIDRGERAKKIRDRIDEKSTKYAKTGLPLILFVFLGDHYILNANHVERALFGQTIAEIEPGEPFQDTVAAKRFGGVFLPDECGLPGHPNLSAVVACDWFDTLNRQNPGRRLHCRIIHHWHPHVILPIGVFRPFPQVIWSRKEFVHIGEWNMVARFV